MKNKVINKISTYFDLVEQSTELMGKANDTLSMGPKKYYFEKIKVYSEALFDKFAPFKEGNRVEISAEIDTDNGWRSSSHFLKEGEQGLVTEVDYVGNYFFANVVFDNESWITSHGPDKGKVNPVEWEDRHSFCMREDKITLIK